MQVSYVCNMIRTRPKDEPTKILREIYNDDLFSKYGWSSQNAKYKRKDGQKLKAFTFLTGNYFILIHSLLGDIRFYNYFVVCVFKQPI